MIPIVNLSRVRGKTGQDLETLTDREIQARIEDSQRYYRLHTKRIYMTVLVDAGLLGTTIASSYVLPKEFTTYAVIAMYIAILSSSFYVIPNALRGFGYLMNMNLGKEILRERGTPS